MSLNLVIIMMFFSTTLLAQTRGSIQGATSGASVSSTTVDQSLPALSVKRFGMNYFTFWEGPSLEDGQTGKNELGKPLDDGLQAYHHASVTYSLNERLNLDLQTRLEHIHTQEEQWRFQGMRIGVSGKLASGEKWSLKGAANTDIPGLNGRDASQETLIFNPGLFAGFNYQFNSRWSFYSMLTPRIYLYRDRDAVTDEWAQAGRSPGQKRQIELRASPTINYAFNDKIGMRTGLDVNYRQFVKNDLNYFRRWPTAWTAGPTFSINKMLNLYTYVQTFPFDGKKMTMETASFGAWISGVLF